MHVASPVESSNAEHCQDMGLPVIAGATSKEFLPEDQACSDADNDRVDSAAKPEETVEELQDSNQESGTLSPEFQQPIGLVVEEPKSDTMILGEVKACECASPQTDAPEETKAQLESEELAAYTDVLGINKREADESFAEAFEVEHEVKRARRSTGSSQDFGNVDGAEHLTAAATLHHTEDQDLANETEATAPIAGAVDDQEASINDVVYHEENFEDYLRPAKRVRTESEEHEG